MSAISETDRWKTAAAQAAVALIENGMVVGLGSGSTAWFALSLLAERVAAGLRIAGIPTSENTERLSRSMGIPLTTFADHAGIDLAIDGADEVEAQTLSLVKGRGGALLREKIVATTATRLVIIVDDSKLVDRLGRGALPVEVASFGWQVTANKLRNLGAVPALRLAPAGQPFVSDGGNYILDCAFGAIEDPPRLRSQLDGVAGVVEHGLFLGLASQVIVGGPDGVRVLPA